MSFCALPNQGFTGIGGVIGTCRAFLEPVAAGSLKAQHTIKNEIGTPFGEVYLIFSLALFCNSPFSFSFTFFRGR